MIYSISVIAPVPAQEHLSEETAAPSSRFSKVKSSTSNAVESKSGADWAG